MNSNSPIPINERRVVWGISQLIILGAIFVLVLSFRNSGEEIERQATEIASSVETDELPANDTTQSEENSVRSFTLSLIHISEPTRRTPISYDFPSKPTFRRMQF